MTYTVEAVGGVLLAIAPETPPEAVTSVEDSLLLAWLAARKQAGQGPVQPPDFNSVLGNIGWTIGNSSTKTAGCPIQDLPSRLIPLGVTDADAAAALLRTAQSSGGSSGKVCQAWWSDYAEKPDAVAFVAVLTAGAEISITLSGLGATLPPRRTALFGPVSEVPTSASSTSYVLDQQVFSGVKDQIAEKLQPYLDQIVRP